MEMQQRAFCVFLLLLLANVRLGADELRSSIAQNRNNVTSTSLTEHPTDGAGGEFGWGWGGGGGGGGGGGVGGGGGWGWGGGEGGWWGWGCRKQRKHNGGGRHGINRRRVHKKRFFNNEEDYKLGEFAQCKVRGRCMGMRLDCPLHCGGPCFYDCKHMCKAHCRR